MSDKRSIDDLSIEELERVLAIKKREARQQRLQRMKGTGRVIETEAKSPKPRQTVPQPMTAVDAIQEPRYEIDPNTVQKRKVVPEFEDAIDTRDFKKKSNSGRIWRMFVNRSLFLVEISAVIGLIVLGIALFNGLTTLEQETAAAQQAAEEQLRASLPTVEPTPQLTLDRVVLPTGHTFAGNQPQFNFAEIPENMRGLVVNQVYLPPDVARVPVTDNTPLRVIIPSLEIDNTIVQGVDWNALQQGVGMLPNGATPTGDGDNVVLAAHNDIYGEIFRYIDQLQAGDEIQIQTRTGFHNYIVREEGFQVDPDAVHVMDSQGTPMLTLISCYPYRVNNKRMIVHADRVDV
ncbi:MAG: sortase [Chloroflexota bacterium]